jgi:lysophospholipase L1-like esterase
MRTGLVVLLLVAGVAALALSSPEVRRRARPSLERIGLLRPYQESPPYRAIVEGHRRENARLAPGCVVLLGDSLTEAFPAALAAARGWVPRGISGDRVRHAAARLDSAALEAPCGSVAVLIGSNDVVLDEREPAEIAGAVAALAERLRAAGKRVVVMTLPPTRGRFAAANPSIGALDDRIRGLTAHGLTVADLHAALADETGALSPRYSADGLHLTPAAYERWSAVLEEALRPPTR